LRQVVATSIVVALVLSAVFLSTEFVVYSRFLQNSTFVLRAWATEQPDPDAETVQSLVASALARAQLYERLQKEAHIVDGMLVNRALDGRMADQMRDQCDSLLFSSLRFVALSKLGLEADAKVAWNAIEASRANGAWLRHPRCPRSTSRDMLIGILIGLAQNPADHVQHLRDLLQIVRERDGFFSDGPVYVSYLTPCVAKLVATLAIGAGIKPEELPPLVRRGYSTNEWSMLVIDEGYEAHLVALTAWLELDLAERRGLRWEPDRFLWQALDEVAAPFGNGGKLADQRLDWTTTRLLEIDPSNLFFRYLRLKAAHALTPAVAATLLTELLAMPQFPAHRLPQNCDRHADYMWQRRAHARDTPDGDCTREYHGADFMWMAGLLTDELQRKQPTVSAH
jgi:hypothetical protein